MNKTASGPFFDEKLWNLYESLVYTFETSFQKLEFSEEELFDYFHADFPSSELFWIVITCPLTGKHGG